MPSKWFRFFDVRNQEGFFENFNASSKILKRRMMVLFQLYREEKTRENYSIIFREISAD